RFEPPREETREQGRPRHLAAQGEPRGHADHVRLRDPHLDEPIRIPLLEVNGHVGLQEIAVEDHVPGVRADLGQGLAEGLARRLGHGYFASFRASNRLRPCSAEIRPSSSAMASSPCSRSGALPCQSGLSSIHETPFPLIVCDTIMVGRSVVRSAWSRASRICSMSWPSISMTRHPKASHFLVTGSMSRMFTTLSDC